MFPSLFCDLLERKPPRREIGDPLYGTLNSRILIVRTPKFRHHPSDTPRIQEDAGSMEQSESEANAIECHLHQCSDSELQGPFNGSFEELPVGYHARCIFQPGPCFIAQIRKSMPFLYCEDGHTAWQVLGSLSGW